MQPPLKRISIGTGQQEGQRMQDVDENFGRVEQAIDTLNANASLLLYWTGTDPQTYLDVITDNLPSLPSIRTSTVTINRGNVYSAVILKRSNTNCKAIIMPHFGTQIIVAVMVNGTWTERTI
jgi:hypothetical protein